MEVIKSSVFIQQKKRKRCSVRSRFSSGFDATLFWFTDQRSPRTLMSRSILIPWQNLVIVCRILQNARFALTFWPAINPHYSRPARGTRPITGLICASSCEPPLQSLSLMIHCRPLAVTKPVLITRAPSCAWYWIEASLAQSRSLLLCGYYSSVHVQSASAPQCRGAVTFWDTMKRARSLPGDSSGHRRSRHVAWTTSRHQLHGPFAILPPS